MRHLRRTDEVLRTGPTTIAALEAEGLTKAAGRAHLVLAAALGDTGDLLAAADHVAAAIASAADPAMESGLRLTRADMLARTPRAGEVIELLVETVADRTAQGDGSGAADARHVLAIAYANTDRLLDAAEVAEEEIAYRLSVDQRSDGPPTATPVRHLLATIYQRLRQPDAAVAQLDAIAGVYAELGQRSEVGQLAQRAGEILDEADRDDQAAAKFLVAADICAALIAAADRPATHLALAELHNRRRHALSLNWAHGPDRALPALTVADQVAERLDASSDDARWELARLDYDAARILWRAGQLASAAQRSGRAAQTMVGLGAAGAAAEARILQAKVLVEKGEGAAAEAAARQALTELPDEGRRPHYVDVLATALRQQGRDDAADVVWSEYGLPRPSTEDTDA
jgi:hypothetical protein